MELECDSGVKSDKEYKEKACKYAKYAKNFPYRAYYYDTNIQNVIEMKNYCDGYI